MYRIAGNFLCEGFNLAIFLKLNSANSSLGVCVCMANSIQITKFKLCQYHLGAASTNLMLVKVSCYKVHKSSVLTTGVIRGDPSFRMMLNKINLFSSNYTLDTSKP